MNLPVQVGDGWFYFLTFEATFEAKPPQLTWLSFSVEVTDSLTFSG